MRSLLSDEHQKSILRRSSNKNPVVRDGAAARNPGQPLECDFYRNPTLLSRLLQHQKHASALRRLQQHSLEASVWVCSKREQQEETSFPVRAPEESSQPPPTLSSRDKNEQSGPSTTESDSIYSIRQLPIHIACNNLAFSVIDSAERRDLEQLIVHLVLAHPAGVAKRDHEHRLPLHEAIRYKASPDIISALLIAAPEAAQELDQNGRSALELNQLGRVGDENHDKIQEMLQRGKRFWGIARQECSLRLKHRIVPAEDASIDSTSVLAASMVDDSTLPTIESSAMVHAPVPQGQKKGSENGGGVQHLTRPQLEQRAMQLERHLAEAYENSFQMTSKVSELLASTATLEAKYQKLASTEVGRHVENLEAENAELKTEVKRLEDLAQAQHELKLDSSGLQGDVSLPRCPALNQKELSEALADKQRLQDEVIAYKVRNANLLSVVESLRISLAESTNNTTISTPDFVHSSAEEDDLDTVLGNAQRISGQKLSPELVSAWKLACKEVETPTERNRALGSEHYSDDLAGVLHATARLYSLSSMELTQQDGPGMYPVEEEDHGVVEDHDVEELFAEAARLYGGDL